MLGRKYFEILCTNLETYKLKIISTFKTKYKYYS